MSCAPCNSRRGSAVAAAAVVLLAMLAPGPTPAAATSVGWLVQFGTPATDDAEAVAVDASGHSYVVGQTFGVLPGQVSAGMIDAFARKYDAAGNEVWTRQFGTAERDFAKGIAVDASGGIWVVGQTFGALPGQTSFGGWDAFVRRYDAAGNEGWTRQFGTGGAEWVVDIALDAAGNAILVGSTRSSLPGQTTAGDYDAYVRKYDPSGNELWTRQFGTAGEDFAIDVAPDGAGNVVMVGDTAGVLAGVAGAGALDAFVRRYDAAGTLLWTRQFGSSSDDFALGVAVDGAGNAFVVGGTDGTLPGQASSGGSDAYTRKYDPTGNTLWFHQFGTPGADEGEAVAVDPTGAAYLVGRTEGSLGEGGSAGGFDAYVQKVGPAGNPMWTIQFGSSADDYAQGVSLDGTGLPLLAGGTLGVLPGQTSPGGRDAFVTALAS